MPLCRLASPELLQINGSNSAGRVLLGCLLEKADGFGTPVAITASILFGLGFSPLDASSLLLIANTAQVAFGDLGTPIIALQADTGLDLIQLSGRAGALLTPFAHIIPVWLIRTYAGWKWTKGILPVLLIAGVSFPFLSSWYQGFTVPGWTGLVSLIPASFAVRGNTGLPKKAQ